MGIECTLQHAPRSLLHPINLCNWISGGWPSTRLLDFVSLDPPRDNRDDFSGYSYPFFARKYVTIGIVTAPMIAFLVADITLSSCCSSDILIFIYRVYLIMIDHLPHLLSELTFYLCLQN